MVPPVAVSNGPATSGEDKSSLETTRLRIEARLERLEQKMEPLARAATAAPTFTAAATDIVDQWGDEPRLSRLY